MSSLAVVTCMIAIAPVLILGGLSLVLKKWKVMFLAAALLLSIGETVYFIARHDQEKLDVMENMDHVESYLQTKYKDEQWVLRRGEGVFRSPGSIEAVFLNEPDAVYLYRIKDNKVTLSGYSSKNEKSEWIHKE
ncbi:hypothetical protein ACFFJY_16390 [Fictibacillus aquaticus]|uniref:Uncharacterized protein n=1 Tax=Fictibacillus aquaticus TaxID=2021314 RepID=A0A235F6I1_9BACL|nr:hypothetical protein [Fictibacillus aquaticus]OYD56890.1 hypothetical protein CGZ90_15150 [Fictibacillus aquaticus]